MVLLFFTTTEITLKISRGFYYYLHNRDLWYMYSNYMLRCGVGMLAERVAPHVAAATLPLMLVCQWP